MAEPELDLEYGWVRAEVLNHDQMELGRVRVHERKEIEQAPRFFRKLDDLPSELLPKLER